MNQPQLTPRDGARIPNKEKMTPEQIEVMRQVEELTKSESAALAVLAQAQAATQVAVEDSADRLQAIMDMMVKCLAHFGVPLPAAIQADIEAKAYDPDSIMDDEDEDGDEDGDEEPAAAP